MSSLLDQIEKSSTDVKKIIDVREDVIMCPSNKTVNDYLVFNEPGRLMLIIGIYEPEPHELLMNLANKVYEYICSLIVFRDISQGVIIPAPADVALTKRGYDSLLSERPFEVVDSNHRDWLLCISFYADVKSYYRLLKLIKGLYSLYRKFNTVGMPLFSWKFENGNSCYMRVDDSLINFCGLGKVGFSSLSDGMLMDKLICFCLHFKLVKRYNLPKDSIRRATERYWSRERMKFG